MARLMHPQGTQMYCYSLGEIDGVEAVLDGLPALNAPDLRDNNAAFNNHTCTGANIFGVWKQVRLGAPDAPGATR